MDIRINKKDIRSALLIITPRDVHCERVIEALKNAGIEFKTKEVGPPMYGYGVDVSILGGGRVSGTTTTFGIHLSAPLLIVEYSSTPRNLKYAVFEGGIAIVAGLGIEATW